MARKTKNEPDDGGPAFPLNHPDLTADYRGMSLRDWFAGQALSGLVAHGLSSYESKYSDCAGHAYLLADAMLAERNK